MNWINGRPNDWINPFYCMDRHIKTKHDICEAGASAMLATVIGKIIVEYGDPDLNYWLEQQGLVELKESKS